MLKLILFLELIALIAIQCEQRTVKSYTNQVIKYCTRLSNCEPDKCCKQIAEGIFGGLGKCVDLPLEGQPCGFGCDCTIGFKCAVNPLCPKCRPICMKNEIVSSLNRYLNEACFDKCKDMMFNHLFKPENCSINRKEGDLCNEYCKCESGSYCAPNILCRNCDDICMNGLVVSSMYAYFDSGCVRSCEGYDYAKVNIKSSNYPSSIRFDSRGVIIFPDLF